MRIFLIAKITGGHELFIPLMMTSVISFVLTKKYITFNIYAMELAKKGELITHDKDKNVRLLMDLDKIIETNFISLKPEMKLGYVDKHAAAKSSRNNFPVVDENNRFLGVLLLDDIRGIMFDQSLYETVSVGSLMHHAEAVIFYEEDPVKDVMKKFQDTGAWNLPVVKDEKYHGFVSKSKLLTAYRRKLIDVSN